MPKKLSQTDFIKRCTVIHHYKYNYSLVEYINNRTTVKIVCEIHGLFEQKPDSHLSGKGCPSCRLAKMRTTQQVFIQRATDIHNGWYNYDKVNYINTRSMVTIICINHGEFQQTAASHLSGRGCVMCGIINNTCNTSDFIHRSKMIHGEKYNYDKVNYATSQQKVIITCNKHGDFIQRPHSHLNGSGCYECGVDAKKSTIDQFIRKANITHNKMYDYSMATYINSVSKIDIICHIHGVFQQSPNDHLCGKGCASCAKSGFDKNKPGYCYYIKFESNTQTLYKIGITNLSVDKRLSSMRIDERVKTTVLQELYFTNGKSAFDLEADILREYAEFKYNGTPIMGNGNTELFTKDVLNLDKNNI